MLKNREAYINFCYFVLSDKYQKVSNMQRVRVKHVEEINSVMEGSEQSRLGTKSQKNSTHYTL